MTAVDFEARVRGCLLGGAVGDALGAPVETVADDFVREMTDPPWADEWWERYPGG